MAARKLYSVEDGGNSPARSSFGGKDAFLTCLMAADKRIMQAGA